MAPLCCHVPIRKSEESKNSKSELGLLDCYGDIFAKVGGENLFYLTYFSMMHNFKYIDIWDVGLLWTCALVLQVLM